MLFVPVRRMEVSLETVLAQVREHCAFIIKRLDDEKVQAKPTISSQSSRRRQQRSQPSIKFSTHRANVSRRDNLPILCYILGWQIHISPEEGARQLERLLSR
jgi:hypothetical protein